MTVDMLTSRSAHKETQMIWLKNTDGKRDAVLTMTLLGFLSIIGKVLAAGMVIHTATREITVGGIDGATIAAILTPTLGAYVARRYTDNKFGRYDDPPDTTPEAKKGA